MKTGPVHMKYINKFSVVIIAAIISTGCARVISGDAQTVSVDTRDLGEIAPGTREWLSWWEARDHCARHSKSPEILDLKGSIAIYKCVEKK